MKIEIDRYIKTHHSPSYQKISLYCTDIDHSKGWFVDRKSNALAKKRHVKFDSSRPLLYWHGTWQRSRLVLICIGCMVRQKGLRWWLEIEQTRIALIHIIQHVWWAESFFCFVHSSCFWRINQEIEPRYYGRVRHAFLISFLSPLFLFLERKQEYCTITVLFLQCHRCFFFVIFVLCDVINPWYKEQK